MNLRSCLAMGYNHPQVYHFSCVHEEIKKSSQSQPSTLMNISDELNNINPLLLEFLNSINNSICERDITNATEHIKKLGYISFFSQLKFCTNPRRPTLIHDLIANFVEDHGN